MRSAGSDLPSIVAHILEWFKYSKKWATLETKMKLNDPWLKNIVFTHPSYFNSFGNTPESKKYQRLEFLGDAVIIGLC